MAAKNHGQKRVHRMAGNSLTITQVLTKLTELGAWADGQVRPLTRHDLDILMQDNATSLAVARPTAQQLPLMRLEFAEAMDLKGVNFEKADLREARMMYANFEGGMPATCQILRGTTFTCRLSECATARQ
jgi:uncharacterized protein YjbI with pentapeptide repeats